MIGPGTWRRASLTAGLLIAMLLAHPGPARAQDVAALQDNRLFSAALAEALGRGDFVQALQILDARPDLAQDPSAIRLRAQLLASGGRADEALAVLEARLSAAPDDALARFQLAEVHFNARRDRAAELAYRLALAGDLDGPRRSIVEGRLAAIQERRDWEFTAGLSLAPDSNINSGTEASTVTLFGLPFDLDDEARRRGGVALSANLGVIRRIDLSAHERLVLSANSAYTEALEDDFSTQMLSLQAGVEQRLGEETLIFIGQGGDLAWIRGGLFQSSVGLLAAVEHRPDARTGLSGSFYVARIEDAMTPTRNAQSYTVQLGETRYLSPSSLVTARLVVERREASADFESFWHLRLSHGWLIPLPYSISAYAEPYVAHRRFDAPDFLFGEARRDSEFGLSFRLSKRDWVFKGAFPYITVSASENRSNIPLNAFSRTRVEFGMSRRF